MCYVMYVVLGVQNELLSTVPKKGAPIFTFIVELFMAWLDDTNAM